MGGAATCIDLVVHPGYRRQGIARALVKQIERVFVAWGVTRVSALVEKDHPGAAKFWDALGYCRDDRMTRHVATL